MSRYDVGARLREPVRFKFDPFKGGPKLVLETPELTATAIDALERPSDRDQSTSASECHKARSIERSRRFPASIAFRTISTFSCDIARSVSRSGHDVAE
jgi:hypothetical protein